MKSMIFLAAASLVSVSVGSAIPEMFQARAPVCVGGPRHSGNECSNSMYGYRTCGPGNDGNILGCGEVNGRYEWEIVTKCRPSPGDSGGGCANCKCKIGPL